MVHIEKEIVIYPKKCLNCLNLGTMVMETNLSKYTDKQFVKF